MHVAECGRERRRICVELPGDALRLTGGIGRAVYGVGAAADTVSADAGFSIRAIHITGQRRTPVATISAALELHENQSIFSADLAVLVAIQGGG